jgi:hypothetical protein
VSIQGLQQNPQDTSNFYLANIYQATINPNGSSLLPASPPTFSPPNYAIWVNALWFLSLVISLTCALLATLLQQWARRYLKVTQPRYSPHKRARIRAFFAEGVDKFLLPWAVEALPTMLHLSLFLFFAGLAVFLWNINLTIFKLVLSWVGLCMALYGCITFIPVFRHDSPYHTPLSLPAWNFIMGIPFLAFLALERLALMDYLSAETYNHFRRLTEGYGKFLVQGMQKTAEETALNSPSEIDTRSFMWTFDCLDEDHELERFFSGLPSFRDSKMVKDPLPHLTWEQQGKLLNAWIGLSDRTLSSDLLPEPVKLRRTVICGKATGPTDIPQAVQRVLDRIVSEDQYGPVQSAEIVRFVRGWDNGGDEETAMIIQAIFSSVVATAQRRDDLWFGMASDEIGVPESVLRNHATQGNNLSIAILIYVVCQQFNLLDEQHWPFYVFWKVLKAASKFDALDTSPELQHEFCAIWNQVRHRANKVIAWNILRPIRNIYLALHDIHTDCAPTQFTTSTDDGDLILLQSTSYPSCNVPGHHADLTDEIHGAAPTAIALAMLHDNAILASASLPDAPSPSMPAPVHIDENPLDVPLLDNDISVRPTDLLAHKPAAQSLSTSAPSRGPLDAARAILYNEASAGTMSRTAPEALTSAASAFSTGEHSLQNIADPLVHPDAPEIPSPTSPEPVLGDITGSSLSLTLSWLTFTTHLPVS